MARGGCGTPAARSRRSPTSILRLGRRSGQACSCSLLVELGEFAVDLLESSAGRFAALLDLLTFDELVNLGRSKCADLGKGAGLEAGDHCLECGCKLRIAFLLFERRGSNFRLVVRIFLCFRLNDLALPPTLEQ